MTARRAVGGLAALALATLAMSGAPAQQPADDGARPAAAEAARAPFNDQPVDDLIGESVLTPGGEQVGYVKDLLTDGRGQFFAVVGIGSYLGLGERNIVIPAEKLQFTPQRVSLAPSMTQDEFEAMPDYASGRYRSIVPKNGSGFPEPRR